MRYLPDAPPLRNLRVLRVTRPSLMTRKLIFAIQ